MFIAVLFMTAKTKKQPIFPLVGEWIHKLWYIQMNYYSDLKKKKRAIKPLKTHRNFKCILVSERSQYEKAAYCMIPPI